jgi:hypothetical protein
MSDESALVPIEQREIDFYEDEITAVLVEEETSGRREVYVPLRHLCNLIGVSYQGQAQRIRRDPVLSAKLAGVNVTFTPDPERGGGGTQTVNCLPLPYLNGWMFGINANRVKPEIKDKLIRYQEDCYQVLADAFLGPYRTTSPTPSNTTLVQIRELGRAIMEQADELIRIEQRQTAVEDRIDNAAQFVGQMNKRLSAVERRVKAGPLTEEQAAEIKKRVNQIAEELAKRDPDKVHYPSIYTALQNEAGVTSYKAIPPAAYEAAVNWLDGWLDAIRETEEE